MRTEYLRYFCVTSRATSFTKAAKSLNISQQGLSRVIKSLEKEYGCTLFRRAGFSNPELTPAGKMLQKLADDVLVDYEKLERSMRRHGELGRESKQSEIVTIAMTLNAMHNIYPHVVEALALAFSSVRFRAVEIEQKDVYEKVSSDKRSDILYFVSLSDFRLSRFADNAEIVFRPLIDSELDCIVGKNSSLTTFSHFTWQDIHELEFVIKKDPAMIDLLALRGISANPSDFEYWTTDSKLLEAILNTRDAVSFSTKFLGLYPDLDEFVHIPLHNTFKTPIGFIGNATVELSSLAYQVRGFIESYLITHYPKGLFESDELIANRWAPVRK